MIGKTISRYKILAKLGAGGMREVYLAEDTELYHPNIGAIFNVEEVAGRRLLIMERVDGRRLDWIIPPQDEREADRAGQPST